ncbi:VgrG protein [Minicystis rosea]|nr:VgrG protein [Minicystis rosea]
MTTVSLPPYQLSIDGFPREHFRVHSLTGKETISEAYSFEIIVTCEPGGDEVERTALGQRAVLLFNVGEEQRAFYGVVASVRLTQVHAVDHTVKYHVRLVPRLWLLKRKKRTRIFQNMRVTDIVSAVLAEAGIATRWQLTRAYPMREYCTQYEETDYRFVKRLLAEAGIYFYFPEGPPVDDAALTADAAIGAAAAAGSTVLDAMGASAVGSIVGQVASIAETLIPGDTVICADDASCYPPMNGDDAAALAASTAAALAPAVGDLFGVGDGIAGAAIGTASAVAGSVIAAVTEGSRDVPVLHFLTNEDARVSVLDKVTRFSLRNTVRSTGAVFRDYDPDRPMVRLQSSSVSTQPFPPSPFEEAAAALAAAENVASVAQSLVPLPSAASGAIAAFESVAETADAAVNAVAGALGQKVPHEVYEHHSPFLFPKWGFANEEAPRILRQKRRRASVATGEGGCSDLSPGHRFALHDHPAPQLDSTYVVVSVEHHGETRPESGGIWRVYRNTFECAPAEMPYPPPRPKRKSVQVSLTATVVGPPGEEIHVDEKGQIKVQFHWDREGKYDDKSSCWIRVMQPWAGASWGHQFIPRVGMEVVVAFEGGDPDKPMVLGSLYNGTHPPPFMLPGDKTRSGIRTQSSPGGGGFNELSFEDAAGNEQIYIHAQKNFNEVVEKNHTLLVKNDEFIRVLANRLDTIEKNLEEHVHGDHKSLVQGNRLDVVEGNSDERVSGMLVTRVEGKERRIVQGATDLEYADDITTRAKGCVTTLVGKNDKKRSWVTHAEGTADLSSTDSTRVTSEKELVLGVGKSCIRITSDKIELISGSVSAKGGGAGLSASDDGLALSSKGDAQVVVGKKLVLKTEGASLAMEKEFKADGQKILLNSPSKAKDPPPKAPKPPTKIELLDESGIPLAHTRFLAVLDDGSEVSGFTDKDGKVELDLPSGGKITFPDLKDTQPG